MIDSRCGLRCTGCKWKESHGCGGCIETNGHPFHGECNIAQCCQNKGLNHCGECDIMPCDELYAYSYLDPEHGDNPPGTRVEVCRKWAAEGGKHRWENVLLTSAGFFDSDNNPRTEIINKFAAMLGKPYGKAKVLFIPTAALPPEDINWDYVQYCKNDLLLLGVPPENIITHDIDGTMTEGEAMAFDIIFFTGGNTPYLAKRVRETGFGEIIKKMVYANKVYVGISAGSMLAMPNFNVDNLTESHPMEFAGLCLIHVYFSVHCEPNAPGRSDLRLPHIPLTDGQALAVRWDGYTLIGG